MDDHPIPSPAELSVIRCSQVSRLHTQLLARAYQRVVPQVRRSLHHGGGSAQAKRIAGRQSTAAFAAGA